MSNTLITFSVFCLFPCLALKKWDPHHKDSPNSTCTLKNKQCTLLQCFPSYNAQEKVKKMVGGGINLGSGTGWGHHLGPNFMK